jgi:hypothetical protein
MVYCNASVERGLLHNGYDTWIVYKFFNDTSLEDLSNCPLRTMEVT